MLSQRGYSLSSRALRPHQVSAIMRGNLRRHRWTWLIGAGKPLEFFRVDPEPGVAPILRRAGPCIEKAAAIAGIGIEDRAIAKPAHGNGIPEGAGVADEDNQSIGGDLIERLGHEPGEIVGAEHRSQGKLARIEA